MKYLWACLLCVAAVAFSQEIRVSSFLDFKDIFRKMSLQGGTGKTIQMIPLDDGKLVEFEEFNCYDQNDEQAVPKDFPKELEVLPTFELANGVFANNKHLLIEKDEQSNVITVGGNVFIHENLVSEEEAKAILEQSKRWVYDYERKDQFTVSHVNISTLPLDVNKPTLRERLTRVLGAGHAFLPEVIPIKRISTHEKLPNHMDNAGFTDATVILYLQDLSSGALAFPSREIAILPKVGRAIMFLTRTKNNTADYEAIHHTMKFSREEGSEFGDARFSIAISVKILGGLNEEWYSNPHQVASKRPAGFCHGIGVYAECNEGKGCVPENCTVLNGTCFLTPNINYQPCTSGVGCSACAQDIYQSSCQPSSLTKPGYACIKGECKLNACRKWGRSKEECASIEGCRFISATSQRFKKLSEKTINRCRQLGDFGCRAVNDCSFQCKKVKKADVVCKNN